MALGKRIQAIRTRRGFTATDLAQRSGVKLKTLDRIEKRDSRKSIHASAIAEALGISTDALLRDGSVDELLNGHAAARSGRLAGKRIAVQEQVKAREGGKLEAMQITAPLGFVEVAQVDANMRAIRIRGDAEEPRAGQVRGVQALTGLC